MNIVIYDPYVGKFTTDMQSWWEAHGHEVKRSTYYDPQLVDWADVLYFYTCDNNIASATNPGQAIMADDANYQPWALSGHVMTGKKVIVNPIDIEVWQGHYAAAHWQDVDDIIFIAPHIRNLVDPDALVGVHENLKIHTIPYCVDINRWTFKERGPGFDIAIISEKWNSKGTHLLLQVILKLQQIDPRYKFHWLGQRSDTPWEYAYFDDFVEHHKLNIEFTNILNDGRTVDEFLEGKNYLLHGSIKEGFSAATAEAAAKGIRPVIHRFYGCDWLWGDSGWVWDSIDEAVKMITEDHANYDSKSYRDYLIQHGYTLDSMMTAIDKLIKGEK